YALWIVVALRLIIPFTLESNYSLMPSNNNVGYIPHDIIYQQSPQINSGVEGTDTLINNSLPAPTVGASVNPLQICVEIGAYIWFLVIVSLLIYSLASILILKRSLKKAQLMEKNIFEAENIRTPFVLGLIRPRIYLPVGLSKQEQDYIIMHEQTHIHRKDHIIKILAFFILSVHWFNPLVWLAFRLMGRDMELSCDERVLKKMDNDIKKPYANSLLSLNIGRHILNGSPLAFGEGNVRGRIKNVLNYKRPAFWVTLISVLFAVAIGVGLLANPGAKSLNGNSDSNNRSGEDDQIATIQPEGQELGSEGTTDRGSIIESFSEMDMYMKDYTFDVSYDEGLEFYQRVYSINGAYDLNGDGEVDEIKAVLKPDYEDGSYVEVNGMKVELNLYSPTGEMRIIDLDSKDSYTEVAVFDNGSSGDPTFTLLRYDGENLYIVGTIDRYALMDGQQKFISWFHLADNFKPQLFSAWGEFKNNEYVITNHDVEQYIGKTYEVDGTGFFVPLDKNPENHYVHMTWDSETLREFKATKIKLLGIHIDQDERTLNSFYVELPDGEKGMLYFWIGD
ncbi:MAG TPA: M56 family metallopeptidase, partial [Clostridia bacterium]|nr:M56 family metallopeptidase [Clostridia bacterium]